MKGAAVIARIAWVKRFHETRHDEFIASVSDETRTLLARSVIKTEWVPVSLVVDVLSTAERLFGNGDYAVCKAMGAYAAGVNLPTIYKLFYRVGSVDYILGKAALLWPVNHDTGRAAVVRGAPKHARYEVHDYGEPNIAICRTIEGFMQKTLELTGVRITSISETQCINRGDRFCAYEADWA